MKTEFFLYTNDAEEITNKKEVRKNLTLKRGKYKVTVEDWSNRTIQQNSYLHLMFKFVQKGLYDNGYRNIKTTDQAKYVCKELFLSYEIENEQTGAKIKMVKRTRDLTKEEMATFIDEVIQWAAEYLNTVITPPNTQTEMPFIMAEYDQQNRATIIKKAS